MAHLPLGRRVCVTKLRLVSTAANLDRMFSQMDCMISSSFKKWTSLFVGWTLTSILSGGVGVSIPPDQTWVFEGEKDVERAWADGKAASL